MALGGESIGRAYVRVLADATGFDDDVRRQMREHDGAFRQAGERSSRAYREGFRNEANKQGDDPVKTLTNALRRGAGRFDALGSLFGDNMMDGLRDQLETRFGDIGTTIFANLRDEMHKGNLDFSGLVSQLENIRPLVARATQEITQDQERMWTRLGAAVDRYGESIDRNGPSRRELTQDMARLRRVLPDVVTNSEGFRNEMQRISDVLINTSPLLDRWANGWDRAGDRVGKVFGKGSRNDALNFFGSLAGGLVSIPRLLSNFLKPFATAARTFATMRASGEGLFTSLASSLRVFAGPALQLGAVVATIGLVVTSLGVLGSALSLATGAVLALAGSLAFGLAGGLIAVGGALVPFAAAFGVGMLAMSAFQQMTKDKKMQGFLKEFKKDWMDLRTEALKGIFGKDYGGLKNLSGIFKSLTPLITPVARALGGLLKQFGDFAKTKGFSTMMSDLGKTLGPMVTQLGQAAGKFGVGFTKAFILAGPYVSKFLGWLNDIGDAFIALSEGGKGSKMAGFFSEAADSAGILWDLVTNIGKIILNLFSAGKGQGDSMLQGLADAAEDLNRWLSDPANHDTIQGWFIDARNFGEKLGTIVEDVGKLIAKLDTPTNRTILFGLLDIADQLIDLIGDVSTAVEDLATDPAFQNIISNIDEMLRKMDLGTEGKEISIAIDAQEGGMDSLFQGIVDAAQRADTAITDWITDHRPDWKAIFAPLAEGDPFATLRQRSGEAWAGIQATWGAVSGFFSGLWTSITTSLSNGFQTIKQRLGELPGQIVMAFTSLPANIWTFVQQMIAPFVWLYQYLVGASLIPDMIMAIVGWFARLPGMIAGALGDISGRFVTWLAGVPQKIQSAVGLVAGAFSGLAGKAIARAGSIVSAFAKWVAGLPAKARAIAVSVATAFTNLAGKIITKAGSLASRFASWVSSLAGKARSTATSIVSGFAGLAGKIITRAGSIAAKFATWVASLPGKAKTIAGKIAAAFSGLAGKIIDKAGDIAAKFAAWGARAVTKAGTVARNIVSKFSGLASDIVKAIGDIVPKIKMPKITVPTVVAKVKMPKIAAGGVFNGPTVAMIGEAGPEAVVPLDRALSRVDPAVRALSAVAQGMKVPGQSGAGPTIGRQIDVGGITINTPTEDPRAVASEVVNRMTFAAYI